MQRGDFSFLSRSRKLSEPALRISVFVVRTRLKRNALAKSMARGKIINKTRVTPTSEEPIEEGHSFEEEHPAPPSMEEYHPVVRERSLTHITAPDVGSMAGTREVGREITDYHSLIGRYAQTDYVELERIVKNIVTTQQAITEKTRPSDSLVAKTYSLAKRTLFGPGVALEELFDQQQSNVHCLINYGNNVVDRMEKELEELHRYTNSNIDRNAEEYTRAQKINQLLPRIVKEYETVVEQRKKTSKENPTYFALDKKLRKLWFDISELEKQAEIVKGDKQYTENERGFLEDLTGRLTTFCSCTQKILRRGEQINGTISQVKRAYFLVPEGRRTIAALQNAIGNMRGTVEDMHGYLVKSNNELRSLVAGDYPALGE